MSERIYRIVVDGLPEALDRRELLELVLAAASLDLRVQVLLLGRARELLRGSEHAGWRQLLEQDLAEVLVGDSEDALAPVPGARWESAAAAPTSPQAVVVVRT